MRGGTVTLEAPRSLFIVGTDTGVGKTRICAALLRGFALRGLRAVGMKPVAAGATCDVANAQWINEDARSLREASNVAVAPAFDNPILLHEPLSPHIAARRAGVRIRLADVINAHRKLLTLADVVVVEGAGGFLVPLDETEDGTLLTGADLAQALDLPLILVVGMRLGCLNHAMLSVECMRARGLSLHGWIANRIDPNMLCVQENIDFLRRHLGIPLLADVAHGSSEPLFIQ